MAFNTALLAGADTITNAEFQAIMQFISNVLQTGGVTKTADTGQINTGSAAWPGSNNTAAGYEIRQFTDTLAATHPILIKWEYGRGGAANQVSIWYTIGTGSDGAGNITNVRVARTQLMTTTTPVSPGEACYVYADNNRFSFIMFNTSAQSNPLIFGIERTLDASKTYVSDGVLTYWRMGNTSSFGFRFVPYTGVVPAEETLGCCFPPGLQTTGLHSDGNVAVYPCYFYGIGETKIPFTLFVGHFVGDFTGGNTYTVEVLGTNQIMVAMYAATNPKLQRGTTPSSSVFSGMMRYE
jgi:hypothetical protein